MRSKADLGGEGEGLPVSAVTGQGLAELKRAIDAVGVKIDAVAAGLTPLSGLQARVDALETEDVERSHARARTAGFIAGVSAIGGVAGSMLTWAAAKFGIH